MEDLLDMIFTEDNDGFWITYMQPEGFWVTRPGEGSDAPGEAEVVKVVDEYETESTSDPPASDCESTSSPDCLGNEAEPEEGGVQPGEAVEGNKDEGAF